MRPTAAGTATKSNTSSAAGPIASQLKSSLRDGSPFVHRPSSIVHCPSPRRLLGHPAAVNDECRACHEGSFIGGEVERRVGDLLRLAHSPQRLASMELLAHFILVVRIVALQVALDEGRMH